MVNGIYGVLLKSANAKRLKEFYGKSLGLTAKHSCDGCVVFELGERQWLTIQDNPTARVDLGETAPVSAAFFVEDLAGFHKALSDKGVRFTTPPRQENWGATTATLVDPDGNKVVLIQEKTGAAKGPPCVARKSETAAPAALPPPAAKKKPL